MSDALEEDGARARDIRRSEQPDGTVVYQSAFARRRRWGGPFIVGLAAALGLASMCAGATGHDGLAIAGGAVGSIIIGIALLGVAARTLPFAVNAVRHPPLVELTPDGPIVCGYRPPADRIAAGQIRAIRLEECRTEPPAPARRSAGALWDVPTVHTFDGAVIRLHGMGIRSDSDQVERAHQEACVAEMLTVLGVRAGA